MSAAQNEFDELMRDKERRTGHPDDDEDAQSFLNLSSDEDEEDDTTPAASVVEDEAPRRASSSLARNGIPLTRYEANTGPKGVISDAQNFRDSRRMHRISMRSNATLPSQAAGGISPDGLATSEKIPESDEDEDLDDGDHDFMRKWRKSRLREMQKGSPRESKLHTRERSNRVWGGLATVDDTGYLDALEKSAPDGVVVVYIYDDYSHVSSAIEDCIRTLAQKHLDVHFIKLHFQDAQMEPAGVPALIAYRGGDKFAALVPLIQEIPDDAELSALTLEMVLKRHQILQ